MKFWTYRSSQKYQCFFDFELVPILPFFSYDCDMTTTFIIIYRLTFRNAFWYSIVRLKFVFKSLKSVFKSATTH